VLQDTRAGYAILRIWWLIEVTENEISVMKDQRKLNDTKETNKLTNEGPEMSLK